MSWQYKQQLSEDEDDEKYINQSSSPQPPPSINPQEDDPLDAFMNELDCQQQQPNPNINRQLEDEEINLYDGKNIPLNQQQQFMDADSDEGLQLPEKKNKIIETLKPFDFSTVVLEPFQKHFYQEHQEIAQMDPETHKKIMKQLQIKIQGEDKIKPIISFGHLPLPEKMLKKIANQGYQKPTPIQAQAIPCVLSGRDVVGIAKTGSGKTMAFVWPMIIHVQDQYRSGKGDGPIALILAPTRQLCQQIFIETKKYTKKSDLRVECILGGQNKHEQWKTLKAGVDILIASPGRLIEFIRKKATNLLRVTYLVLDEADRMMSLGFQQQIRSIVSQTREDRQTLLFTATMKKSMQMLVGDVVTYPLKIFVGEQGAANEDVKQEVVVVQEHQQKLTWIFQHIFDILREGKVLIFVNHKQQCENLGLYLVELKIDALVLHGDKAQYERTSIMNAFKHQKDVLIATDIASRGIDVKNIKTVINFECPKNIEVYIHRIGRAGRAGETGTAYSFLQQSDIRFAVELVKVFENSGYPVSDQLQDLAMLDDNFRRKRISSKMGVTFAKGKDATKFLNHAIKKQRKGFSKAGLGLEEEKNKKNKGLDLNEEVNEEMSIGDISKLIKQKMEDKKKKQKFGGQFILSTKGQIQDQIKETTIIYRQQKK